VEQQIVMQAEEVAPLPMLIIYLLLPAIPIPLWLARAAITQQADNLTLTAPLLCVQVAEDIL
jgi:hypothetical protein